MDRIIATKAFTGHHRCHRCRSFRRLSRNSFIAKAILTAQAFVEVLLEEQYEPKRVAASAVGGVAVTQRNHNNKVYVAFFNDGKVFALFSDGSSEPISKEILAGYKSFKALMKEKQEYLDA